MANPIYRFYLQIGSGTLTECHPIWKADASIDYALESSYRFFRKSLNGKLDFVRDDYTLIMSATFEQTLTLYMEISTDMGLTWSSYWQGTFSRTDCTIDYDDKRISVQPNVSDDYKTIIDNLDKEFNLIELKPQTDRMLVTKRPLIQMYVLGDSVVSCFLSGANWEEDADEIDSAYTLTNTYHFGLNTILKEIELTSVSGLAGAEGTYTGRVFLTDADQGLYSGELYESTGTYYIDIESYGITIPVGGGTMTFSSTIATLCRVSDNAQLYKYQTSGEFDDLVFTMSPVSGSGMSGTMSADMFTYNVFARILCDVETLRTATYAIPSDDIVENNRNYKRCLEYTSPSAYLSNNSSVNPTEYGKRDDGTYFDLPTATPPYGEFHPIAQSTWRYASLWYAHSTTYLNTEILGRKTYLLRDAYEIGSCISVLLAKIGSSITHDNTSTYSEFLYGTTNPVSGDKWYLYMTQKTNILRGEYTQPATKAETSLGAILKMLQYVFDCRWWVENGKLRIEHISYLKNGGSYASDIRTTGYDLTTLLNVKNNKPWCYGQSEITYDKVDMPSQYKWSWMDETTQPFDGFPINIVSPNAQPDKIEDTSVGSFTSDVDYMLLNPSGCSDDGFALLAGVNTDALNSTTSSSSATYGSNDNASTPLYPIKTALQGIPNDMTCTLTCSGSGNAYATWFDVDGNEITDSSFLTPTVTSGTTSFTMTSIPDNAYYFGFVMTSSGTLTFDISSLEVVDGFELPFVTITYGGETYAHQNGYLAMTDLQPKYLTYDLPSRNIEVNGATTTANGIQRKAKHTLTFPSDAVEPDTSNLVKTSVGFGEFNSLSLNLSSRQIKATLNYDNDI